MKSIPQRMCVVCREMKGKPDLVRIVLNNSTGLAEIDNTGKKNGRGAYVCKNKECIESLQKRKVLNRTFSTNIGEEIYEELRSYIE